MFGNFFNRKKKPVQSNDDWKSKLVWLPVGHPDNPFPEEVLDCRAVALTFHSATKDQSIAESFNRLRSSDGTESRGKLPENSMVVDCELRFPYDGQHHEGPMYVARQMEDKWDFYAYDKRLYVRRSWTGQLTHVAELEYSSDVVLVKRIRCEPNTVFKEPDFAITQLHFLITTHLGRTLIPFPILPDFPKTGMEPIALMAFNSYGRRAQFGRYIKLRSKS
jgi:hypothetical protein